MTIHQMCRDPSVIQKTNDGSGLCGSKLCESTEITEFLSDKASKKCNKGFLGTDKSQQCCTDIFIYFITMVINKFSHCPINKVFLCP